MISVTVQAVTKSSTLSSLCTWGRGGGGEKGTGEADEPRAPQRSRHAAVQQEITHGHAVVSKHSSLLKTNANGMLNTDTRRKKSH